MSDPPTNVRALQAEQVLEVTWTDARVDPISYFLLRGECPCAACRNEWTGERMLDPKSIRPDLKLVGMENIGTYAIQLSWNDGHSSGLFSWDTLRRSARLRQARTEAKTRVAASQTDPHLLTVAIPTCNGASHVAETVRSILAQSGPAFELIVVDDRSEDDTLAVIREIAGDRARIEVNSERLGLAGNWNRCVAFADTPLVAIFHQDDVMLPGHLSAHVASFNDDRSLGMIASASMVIDDRGKPVPPTLVEQGGLGPINRVIEPGRLAVSMAGGNPLRCSAVTLNVAAFQQVGGFDPSLRYVVDWDLWLRVSRAWRVAWLESPTVLVRWHSASETHRFKTGMADLDESAHMLETLFELDLNDHTDIARLRHSAYHRLGRAFLNRADDALRAGLPELASDALHKGFQYSPSLIKTVVANPKLCVKLAALAFAPRLAARFFARPKG